MSQEIIHTAKFKEAFGRLCQESVDKIFILTDETTHRLCRPLLKQWDRLDGATDIVIPPTDVNKTLKQQRPFGRHSPTEGPRAIRSWFVWAAAW